jgi:hypothetical protein
MDAPVNRNRAARTCRYRNVRAAGRGSVAVARDDGQKRRRGLGGLGRRAHPVELDGHSSITVAMDLYCHLFPDEKDRLAAALEDTWRAARENPAASSRPDDVVELAG